MLDRTHLTLLYMPNRPVQPCGDPAQNSLDLYVLMCFKRMSTCMVSPGDSKHAENVHTSHHSNSQTLADAEHTVMTPSLQGSETA